MPENTTKQYEVTVYGRVQGVGFRASARRRARSLDLSGWVRNNDDGSVTSVIKGDEFACHQFINWCRNGSGYSWVKDIRVEEQVPSDIQGYKIMY